MFTRLWTGALLIAIGLGILILDAWLAPWFPVLLVAALCASMLSAIELQGLLPSPGPRPWLTCLGVALVILANWPSHVLGFGEAWHWIGLTAVGVFMLIFLVEATQYRQPGEATLRISLAWLTVGYLGVLPSFLLQLRWLPEGRGLFAFALGVFVPKVGDIAAYFTGRAFGRHPMSPILSPKKTWEGAAGGLAASVAVALGINALALYLNGDRPLLTWPMAAAFGVVVGVVAQLGDLMESLLKRDRNQKDAAQLIPSFGGVLDVLDSILFSAPVSYVWLACSQ
jgi:phosphatidate cytidylyltransferase